jgi:lactoylglutathione lyase
VKLLHTAIRVTDLERSRRFYATFGFIELGATQIPGGSIVVLNLPGDGDEVTLELFYDDKSNDLVVGDGLSHLVVQVDDIEGFVAELRTKGLQAGDIEMHAGAGDADGPKTSIVRDPDGHAIELVQWPPGHPVAMTRADFEPQP